MIKGRINVAVVGVGAVGMEMLRLLRSRNFPVAQLKVFARTERPIDVDGVIYQVKGITPEGFEGIDVALFAGTEGEQGASVQYAVGAVKRKCVVIDNGADFRLNPKVPLVVPEVNGEALKDHKGVIANPNCSTIQMVAALSPIYKNFGIKRILASTYQSASGAGRGAQEQLWEETQAAITAVKQQQYRLMDRLFLKTLKVKVNNMSLPHQLAFNCFPHIGSFGDFGYTSEEWKLVKETWKIFNDNSIHISATCVRVPVFRGHAEAIYIETRNIVNMEKVKEVLSSAEGIKYLDKPEENLYPQPIDSAAETDVFVGRVRKDPFNPYGLWLWVVADNLWKGAALNAIQIAEYLVRENLLLKTQPSQ